MTRKILYITAPVLAALLVYFIIRPSSDIANTPKVLPQDKVHETKTSLSQIESKNQKTSVSDEAIEEKNMQSIDDIDDDNAGAITNKNKSNRKIGSTFDASWLEQFQNEPVDYEWAVSVEQNVRQELADFLKMNDGWIEQIDCRSKNCLLSTKLLNTQPGQGAKIAQLMKKLSETGKLSADMALDSVKMDADVISVQVIIERVEAHD